MKPVYKTSLEANKMVFALTMKIREELMKENKKTLFQLTREFITDAVYFIRMTKMNRPQTEKNVFKTT